MAGWILGETMPSGRSPGTGPSVSLNVGPYSLGVSDEGAEAPSLPAFGVSIGGGIGMCVAKECGDDPNSPGVLKFGGALGAKPHHPMRRRL